MNPEDRRGKLRLFLATMVVAGGMIGSGIFLLPASLAGFSQSSDVGVSTTLTGP